MSRHLLVLALACLILTAQCTTIESNFDQADSIVFIVKQPDAAPGTLPGVDVLLVGPRGKINLGRTDELGQIELSKELLAANADGAVLFCTDWFFCGATLIEDADLLKRDDFLIVLSPYTVR